MVARTLIREDMGIYNQLERKAEIADNHNQNRSDRVHLQWNSNKQISHHMT